jgi:hypothetical protein
MSGWQYDSNESGMLTVFKGYEVEELRYLWGLGRDASSREVWVAVNASMGKDSISRASIINSLNRMVQLGVLNYSEITGKGGHRGLYSPKMDEKQLREFIASILAKSIRENLTSTIRA